MFFAYHNDMLYCQGTQSDIGGLAVIRNKNMAITMTEKMPLENSPRTQLIDFNIIPNENNEFCLSIKSLYTNVKYSFDPTTFEHKTNNQQLCQTILYQDYKQYSYSTPNEKSEITLNNNIIEVLYNDNIIKIQTNFNNLEFYQASSAYNNPAQHSQEDYLQWSVGYQSISFSPHAININFKFNNNKTAYFIIPKALFHKPPQDEQVLVQISIPIEKVEPYQKPSNDNLVPPQNPVETDPLTTVTPPYNPEKTHRLTKITTCVLSHIKKYSYRYCIVPVIFISYAMYRMALRS